MLVCFYVSSTNSFEYERACNRCPVLLVSLVTFFPLEKNDLNARDAWLHDNNFKGLPAAMQHHQQQQQQAIWILTLM